MAEDADLAAGDADEVADRADQRRLARAVGTEQAEELARRGRRGRSRRARGSRRRSAWSGRGARGRAGESDLSSSIDDHALGPSSGPAHRRGEREYDIYSRLLNERIIFLGTPIDDQVAQPHRRPAPAPGVRRPRQGHLDLHQLAGRRRSTRAWRSTTRCSSSSPTCTTICFGIAMSMGSLLLTGGAKGKRLSLPNSPDPDPPAVGRLRGPVHGHRDPRPRDPQDARADRRDLRPPHRAARSSRSTRTWSATASSRPTRPSSTGSSTRS